ncbi:hypothetical protein H4R33_004730 [Dimargaris cristalligena]|nr:hypothetical protein H4R33_004730 [Dimargaris cristalligena]
MSRPEKPYGLSMTPVETHDSADQANTGRPNPSAETHTHVYFPLPDKPMDPGPLRDHLKSTFLKTLLQSPSHPNGYRETIERIATDVTAELITWTSESPELGALLDALYDLREYELSPNLKSLAPHTSDSKPDIRLLERILWDLQPAVDLGMLNLQGISALPYPLESSGGSPSPAVTRSAMGMACGIYEYIIVNYVPRETHLTIQGHLAQMFNRLLEDESPESAMACAFLGAYIYANFTRLSSTMASRLLPELTKTAGRLVTIAKLLDYPQDSATVLFCSHFVRRRGTDALTFTGLIRVLNAVAKDVEESATTTPTGSELLNRWRDGEERASLIAQAVVLSEIQFQLTQLTKYYSTTSTRKHFENGNNPSWVGFLRSQHLSTWATFTSLIPECCTQTFLGGGAITTPTTASSTTSMNRPGVMEELAILAFRLALIPRRPAAICKLIQRIASACSTEKKREEEEEVKKEDCSVKNMCRLLAILLSEVVVAQARLDVSGNQNNYSDTTDGSFSDRVVVQHTRKLFADLEVALVDSPRVIILALRLASATLIRESEEADNIIRAIAQSNTYHLPAVGYALVVRFLERLGPLRAREPLDKWLALVNNSSPVTKSLPSNEADHSDPAFGCDQFSRIRQVVLKLYRDLVNHPQTGDTFTTHLFLPSGRSPERRPPIYDRLFDLRGWKPHLNAAVQRSPAAFPALVLVIEPPTSAASPGDAAAPETVRIPSENWLSCIPEAALLFKSLVHRIVKQYPRSPPIPPAMDTHRSAVQEHAHRRFLHTVRICFVQPIQTASQGLSGLSTISPQTREILQSRASIALFHLQWGMEQLEAALAQPTT